LPDPYEDWDLEMIVDPLARVSIPLIAFVLVILFLYLLNPAGRAGERRRVGGRWASEGCTKSGKWHEQQGWQRR
jgi:hypothetical protein